MTTTETVTPDQARRWLFITANNHTNGIGTPDSMRRNYSLTEALGATATCERFTTQELNGVTILTGHNPATGNHRWYLDLTPAPEDPWK